MRCAARCGRIVADATGKSPAQGLAMAMRFLRATARRRSAAIGPAQARSEAMALASLRAELGVAADEPEAPTADAGGDDR
jgi:glycerol-3-phosphate dehydrogenase